MKTRILLIVLLALLASACQRDFDEVKDTEQRHILFHFNTDSLFTTTLFDDNGYGFHTVDTIPADSRLRIMAYCYDEQNDLVCSERIVTTSLTNQYLKIRHLLQGQTYRFVFVADIVTYDPYVDYYETWFQLGTHSWKEFYIHSDTRKTDAIYNVLGDETILLQPENQEHEVFFHPISYNGYCIFNRLDSVDRLSGYLSYCASFRLRTMKYIEITSLANEFDYHAPSSQIIRPMTYSFADSIMTFKLRVNTVSGIDSAFVKIRNPKRQPFVATFDCSKPALDTCVFY